jgi:hypothetical protein
MSANVSIPRVAPAKLLGAQDPSERSNDFTQRDPFRRTGDSIAAADTADRLRQSGAPEKAKELHGICAGQPLLRGDLTHGRRLRAQPVTGKLQQ